jgi:hypothetical protein
MKPANSTYPWARRKSGAICRDVLEIIEIINIIVSNREIYINGCRSPSGGAGDRIQNLLVTGRDYHMETQMWCFFKGFNGATCI